MSLFGQSNKYTDEENRNITLAELAGGGAGLGTGFLASFPLDAAHQKRLLSEAQTLNSEKEKSKQLWTTLLKAHKGEIDMDKLHQVDRLALRKMLEENADDLEYFSSHPQEVRRALNDFDKGKVHLFPDMNKPKIRGRFPHKVQSPFSRPLTGGLGLAGMISGGMALKNHYGKDKVDPTEEIQARIRSLEERLDNR